MNEKRVDIRPLLTDDCEEAVELWNSFSDVRGGFAYKEMSEDEFRRTFSSPPTGVRVVNLTAVSEQRIVGFANGALNRNEKRGFITMILVSERFQRRGIGTSLLRAIEDELIRLHSGIDRFETMFFNPIQLVWIVPGTSGHEHPNAPGVDIGSDGYSFLSNAGYLNFAHENSYYRSLAGYSVPANIGVRYESLASQGLRVARYDSSLHHGFGALFDDLANEQWREIITDNFAEGGAQDPVLIIEENGSICGFTGPISVEKSGRGYFAGIGVHSGYRGRGAGTVLFSSLCAELKGIGAEYMTLFTGETNPARKIYEAAGFKIVKTWACMRKER